MSLSLPELQELLFDHIRNYADWLKSHADGVSENVEREQQLNARLLRAELELIFLKKFLFEKVIQSETWERYAEDLEAFVDQTMLGLEKDVGSADAARLDSYLRPSEYPDPSGPPSEPPAPEKPA